MMLINETGFVKEIMVMVLIVCLQD